MWTILIIGATGDLSRTRLIPTLYEMLIHENHPSFTFFGAAKGHTTSEQLLQEALPNKKPDSLAKLAARSSYEAIDFEEPNSFSKLAQTLEKHEKRLSSSGSKRLIYLAIDSHWFAPVTQLLCETAILKKSPTHRIIYEKPFGWDLQSAQQINREITQLLDEYQIYRIDHYMTKALVTSLLTTRMSNVFFEPIWNSDYIEQIQIILSEKDTVQKRGTFYDQYGALKDVVQNHMLQLLACIGMEKPPSLEHETVSIYKQEVLRHLRITKGLRGQYTGYKDAPGVNKNSTRETYALLRAQIDTPRWQGVPFFLKTGKALDRKSTEIHLIFKPQKFPTDSVPFDSNRLIIRISPDSAILLTLNAQKIREPEVVPISLEFCYRCTFGTQPHSYETLFYDVMQGDKSATVTFEEIAYSWESISALEKLNLPLYSYARGSSGPEEAQAFTKLHAITWYMSTTPAESTN